MSIYDFKVLDASKLVTSLEKYKGKVVIIVNTASKCGLTPQYKELESLYQKYKTDLEIIAFPCNQFGNQEPGSNEEIAQFCELNYGVSFSVMDKVDVNGEQASELFKYLKNELPGLLGSQIIKWNFTKFLIDRDGMPIKRFAPKISPLDMEKDILKLIN